MRSRLTGANPAVATDRLTPMGVIPVTGLNDALRELERCKGHVHELLRQHRGHGSANRLLGSPGRL